MIESLQISPAALKEGDLQPMSGGLCSFFQAVVAWEVSIFIHTHLRSEQRPSGGTNDRDQADQAERADRSLPV